MGARSPGLPLDGARTEVRTPVRSRARRAERAGEPLRRPGEHHMAHVHALRCRECGREYDVAPIFTCEWCFGPLEVTYDYDAIRASVSRESIAAGPLSIWRYADLLPGRAQPRGRPRCRASRRSCGPTGSRPSSASASCGSRTTPRTRRTRSRTASPRSRCRRRSSSASRSRRARRPATSPTRSRPTPRTRGCGRSCSSPPTSSRARSSRPRSTAATSSRSTATTTT